MGEKILNYPILSNTVNQKSNWSINWESSADKCDPKGLCGLNGYCTIMDQWGVCNCIPGFNFINESRPNLGCQLAKLEADQSCGNKTQNSISINTLENTVWEDNQYSILLSSTEVECQNACLADSNCDISTLKDQNCRKGKLPLRYGRKLQDTSATITLTFVKVSRMNCSSLTPPSDHGAVTKGSKGGASKGMLIISLAFNGCACVVLAIFGFLVYRYRILVYKKISSYQANNIGLVEEIGGLRSFTYVELEKVTEGFKEVVGRGAFSTVFKGTLSNGTRNAAVKRLDDKLFDEREREFKTEMRVIAKTHHRNLVQLLGYCCDGPNRLLVYEYMSNGSLALLFNSEIPPPSWHERKGIALNIAKGMLYLHEECDTQIIHCDIKPQNILMDENRCPKIADFGLAKLLKADQTRTQTGIRGTRGYVAPEWWHPNLAVTVKAVFTVMGSCFWK
ncbi:G-type lectin S-receptor-like serine/threonine-protein kinase LECRK4 [Telopea speciosissima]|uniref:G-type lectin S-receptor-like serine/threonine-protein kinase LECRK4 n=1 Tax=Telopea speciosissima TaxID=54955 RepID=UPI001CC34E7E|nr:G-type lectin S-receptor-like serine/threonine-protein kinase LECRK4 [Telopea speciosissima]